MKYLEDAGLFCETFKVNGQIYKILTNSVNILRMLICENHSMDGLVSDYGPYMFEMYILVVKGYSNFRIGNSSYNFELDPISPVTLFSDGDKKFLLIKNSNDYYSVRWAISTLLAKAFEEKKDVFSLHASCVVLDEVGTVVFVGSKNAGKSSLITTLLTRYGGRFVSDDTTMIDCSQENVVCFGMFGGLNLVEDNKYRIRRKMYAANFNSTTQKNRYIVKKDMREPLAKVDFLVFPNWKDCHNNDCELLPYNLSGEVLQRNMVFDFNQNYAYLHNKFLKANIPAYEFKMCNDIDKNCVFLIDTLKG